jgi:hypothetical protein
VRYDATGKLWARERSSAKDLIVVNNEIQSAGKDVLGPLSRQSTRNVIVEYSPNQPAGIMIRNRLITQSDDLVFPIRYIFGDGKRNIGSPVSMAATNDAVWVLSPEGLFRIVHD